MSKKSTRERIVELADELFYQQGFTETSFADIAEKAGLSRGNFYYHFKSKDQILEAVIHRRLINTQALLDSWERANEIPAERIRSFIHILIANWTKIKLYGCPVGTLNTEMVKLDHVLQNQAAEIFSLFRLWLAKQFILAGKEKDSDKLAMHLLARSQGVATLASTFQDKQFVQQEVQYMCDWLAAQLKT